MENKVITKEELAKMTKEEVGKLLREKQINCRTCAEEVEMYTSDIEYILIKERLLEFYNKKDNKGATKYERDFI